MNVEQKTVVWAVCGSFCSFADVSEQMKGLAVRYRFLPLMSETAYSTSTRFGDAGMWREMVIGICGREIIHTISGAEPLGPQIKPDAMVLAPCTGNTLAKMAQGITDSAATMAAKSQLRSDRPVVIALATNDALSANLKNIGAMLGRKNVYFVPMSQDDPQNKPHSMIADFTLIGETLEAALDGRQLQPLFK